MHESFISRTFCLALFGLATAGLFATPALADLAAEKAQIKETRGLDGIQWSTRTPYRAANLVVVGPDDFRMELNFGPEDTLFVDFAELARAASPDGFYKYELRFSPLVNESEKALAREARALGQKVDFLVKHNFPTIAGNFSLKNGNVVDRDVSERDLKDFVINDDLIVDGSACVGFDCVNGESFGFDTLRLKENNLRIKFDDTSTASSYPRNDWQLTANDSANGGASKFSIDDISGNRTPFTVEANARSHALYVDDGGRIGSRTSTPSVEIHTIDGDTPTLRLQQDGSSGFAPQTWDVAGNETNFFIRDVTNGSTLPFRIRPDSPTNSIFINTPDGDIGMGTSSPEAELHIVDAGAVQLRLDNTNSGVAWNLNASGATGGPFRIAEAGAGTGVAFEIDTDGDAAFKGTCIAFNTSDTANDFHCVFASTGVTCAVNLCP